MDNRKTICENGRYDGLAVFITAFLISAAALLPYIIQDGGLFLYYGDFNLQQIPFYMHAHDMVRDGSIMWDFYTDLGVNFIGSYSFYLLFSPFFWLTLLFPSGAVPYLMAPLLMLKAGCAALTAFLYLRRFTRDSFFAGAGGLLYAFSGFTVYNIFFNHFYEPIIFFPLLLLGMEEVIEDRKYGRFALAIFLNLTVNYWFFIGSAIFTAIYFFIRYLPRERRIDLKTVGILTAEVIIGMLMGMAVLLPSAMAIIGNPRTAGAAVLNGENLWLYSSPERYLAILHAIFIAPDMPALANWFPNNKANWASLSAYIPIFGTICTIAYMKAKKGNWLTNILKTSFVFLMVPCLNHLFVLMNSSYYTRWLYAPTLMAVLATVLFLEKAYDGDYYGLKTGVTVSIGVILLLTFISGLTPKITDKGVEFGLYKYPDKFLITGGITLAGAALTIYLFKKIEESGFKKLMLCVTAVSLCLFTNISMFMGKSAYPDNSWIKDTAIPLRNEMSKSEEGVFERVDFYECERNMGLYLNLPTIDAFHSIVPPSVMNYYNSLGIKRDVTSDPPEDFPEIRDMLSVRWLYTMPDEVVPMENYSYRGNLNGMDIYENINYIPMGFSYDISLTENDIDTMSKESRAKQMLGGIYLSDEDIENNKDILTPADAERKEAVYDMTLAALSAERRAFTLDSFTVTKKGFEFTADFPEDRIIFISVPYDKGWSAEINGEAVPVMRANEGFMAVRVPKGKTEGAFAFIPQGLKTGCILSAAGFILLFIYAFTAGRYGRKPSRAYFDMNM